MGQATEKQKQHILISTRPYKLTDMSVKDWMPKEVQIQQLHDRFIKLNPEFDPQLIDFSVYVTDQSYNENLMDLANAYPQYSWFEDESDVNRVRDEAKEDLEGMIDYMVSNVPEEMQDDLRELLDERLGKWVVGTRRLVTANRVKQEQKKIIQSLNTQVELYKEKLGRAIADSPKPKGDRVIQWDLKYGRELEKELKLIYADILVRSRVSKSGKMDSFDLIMLEMQKDPLVTEKEARERIKQAARDISDMWASKPKGFKILPRKEPEKTPEKGRIRRPTFEDDNDIPEMGGDDVSSLLPTPKRTKAKGQMPYPRRPTGSEIDQFKQNYDLYLLYSGNAAYSYRKQAWKIFINHTYKSWGAANKAFELLKEAADKDIELAIPFELLEERQIMTPDQMSPEEQLLREEELRTAPDSIKQFVKETFKDAAPSAVYGSTVCMEVTRLVSIYKNYDPRPDVTQMALELSTFYGPTTEDTIRDCLRQAIKENAEAKEQGTPWPYPNLIIVPPDYLDKLIGK